VSVGWCNTYEGKKVSRVAMCEVRSRKNGQKQKKNKKKTKKKTVVSSKKKSTMMSPIRAPNEKTQPIQWTKRPTGALVAVNSL
jgi:hypothetical protein